MQSAVSFYEQIYQPGFDLSKLGVMLLDLTADATMWAEIQFEALEARDKSQLISAVDSINDRFGRGSIHVASAVSQRMRREFR